jgi:O-antigen/teichoic acid export membrane protein
MGIVLKQGSRNAVYTYMGFLIGAIYTALLVPKVFADLPELWGAARLLTSFALILAPWALVGSPMAVIKYFPIYRKNALGSFLFAVLFWVLLGLIVVSVAFYFISSFWISGSENSLFTDHYYLVFPLLVGYVLFEISSAIAKSLYKTVITVALKEFWLRLIVLVDILLFWGDKISLNTFLIVYSVVYLVVFVPLFLMLLKEKELKLKIDFKFLSSKEIRPVYVYALFGILSVGAAVFLTQIDTLMIGKYLNLKDVAIYGPSLFIATSIVVPSRAIMSIVTPIVANAWAENAIDTIKDLYRKTSIAPMTITILLFLLVWTNIDLIMHYYGKDFGNGKYIVLFISLGNIMNIATGINGTIINTSRLYKVDIVFQLVLIVLTVSTNIILIPIYGLNGAALATGITILLYNTLKLIFVYVKFNMQPFSLKTVLILLIGVLLYILIELLPHFDSLLVNSIIYSSVLIIVYPLLVYFLHISDDINMFIDKTLFKRNQ